MLGYDFNMNTITIPKAEYADLLERQERMEKELDTLKHVIYDEFDEARIRPSVLKRWDKISQNIENGKGRSFSSIKAARKWLASF